MATPSAAPASTASEDSNPTTAAPAGTATAGSTPANATAGSFTANASLYVGDLYPEVTEAMLFEIFNSIGPVSSIRVCRDAVTRRSLGYAYVNYHNPADCDRAIEELNYYPIKGRSCRIMWSQRDPSLRRRGDGNIFIKNLDKTIDSKALYDTFSAFGEIMSCKVAMDENGSRGYGFVHFETREAAEKAIKAVNGMLVHDKKVFVGLHIPRRERESKEEEIKKNFTNIFVKNISESVDDEKFEEMFGAYGTITSAALTKDENGKSKGFGFVNFVEHEGAEKAIEELNGKEIDGKPLFVGRAQKKSEREEELRKRFEQMRLERLNKYQGVNLYVKNLDEAIDDDRLRQEFGVYGNITSARVMRDEKGDSKGFAFVCYSAPEEATKAVTEMNNKIIGSKPVYVALAQRRESRRAMLEAQYAARQQMRQQAATGMMPMPYGAPMMYPGQPNMPPVPPQGFMYPGQMPGVRPGMPYPGMPQMFGMQPGGRMPPRPSGPRSNAPRPMGPRPQGPGMMYPQGGMGGQPPRPKFQGSRPPANNAMQAGAAGGAQPLAAAALAKLDPAQQRQMIGERLYPLIGSNPLVNPKYKDFTGKITGMLLEMEVSELLHLLESPEALHSKLEEAIAVLEQYLQQQQA